MSRLIRLYAEGESLEDIAFEVALETNDEVKEELKRFIEGSKSYIGNGKRHLFNEQVKDVIAERYVNGYSIYAIVEETDLPISTVSNFIKSRNISTKRRFQYEKLKWNNFDCCPTCKSTRNVRRLGVHNLQSSDANTNQAFCTKCNTEWYKEGGQMRKVNWEMIK